MRRLPFSIVLLVSVVLVAGCSGSDAETDVTPAPTGAPPTAAPPPATSAAAAAPASGPVRVEVSADGHLVDGDGRALYLFTLDDQRTSTCVGACAESWPPLLGSPEAGPGVDPSLLGNAERSDRTVQVTYAGQPLYYYSGDGGEETSGHGFNGYWFLVDPTGEPFAD